MALIAFYLMVFSISVVVHASYKIPNSGSIVADLWSSFELQLHDAVFEALDVDVVQPRRRRSTRADEDVWTGFVPNLYQNREQLVVDSIRAISSNIPPFFCLSNHLNNKTKLLEPIMYRRRNYITAACGDRLNLYKFDNSSSTPLVLLDSQKLVNETVGLKHVKLFHPVTGDVELFILVLTPENLDIYIYRNEKLEFSLSQKLFIQYNSIDILDLGDAIYFLIVKTTSTGRSQAGIFKLDIDIFGQIVFNFIASKLLQGIGSSAVRMCVVNDQALFFQSSTNNHLNIYLFDGNAVKDYQVISAPGITDSTCFRNGSTHYLALTTLSSIKVFQFIDSIFQLPQSVSLSLSNVTTIASLMPPTYRDESFLMVSGLGFVDLLLLNATTLTFQPLKETCSDRTINWDKLPQTLTSVSCLNRLGGNNGIDLSTATSFIQDSDLWLVLPAFGDILLVNINFRLEPVASPVIQQLVRVQEHLERSASDAQIVEARSKDFLEFSKGIVLYGKDVQLEGSWKVGTLQVPSVPVENLDNNGSNVVDFNPNAWIPGLDIVVKELQTKMDELDQLISTIENRLRGAIVTDTMDEVQFDKLIVDGTLLIHQLQASNITLQQLNGLDFDNLVDDMVKKNSDSAGRLIDSLKVLGTLTTDSLTAKRVNDILVEDAAVSGNSEININGNLTINNDVKVDGHIFVEGNVNGVDLSNQLLTPDYIYDNIVFTDNVTVWDLLVDGYVDGINVSNVLPNVIYDNLNATEIFLGPTHFDTLAVDGDLIIKSHTVGNVNLTALNASALRLNASQQLEGSLDFKGGVIMKFLGIESINKIKFEDFLLKTSDMSNITLTGEKTFHGPVTVGQLKIINGRINGHRMENAFTLDTNQSITGTVHLQDGMEIPNGDMHIVTLNGADWVAMMEKGVHPALMAVHDLEKNVTIHESCSVNGILTPIHHVKVPGENEYLDVILDDLVYADDKVINITGEKMMSSWTVSSLQHADGHVNGLKLLKDLLTKSTDQTISGRYKLLGDVEFSSLNVTDHLNEYNVDELLDSILLLNGSSQTITSRLRFDEVNVSRFFAINGSINGVRTDEMLLEEVDQIFTAPQKLTSPSFSRLNIGGNLHMKDYRSLVNQLDLDVFDRRRVTVSSNQWISGSWFLNSTNLSIINPLSIGTLNGLTVQQWMDDYLRFHSPTEQVIDAQKIELLDRLVILGDITTTNGISGYDLARLDSVAGDIRTNITFPSDVSFEDIESRELRVMNGKFNQHSLQELRDQAVYLDQTNRSFIGGIKTFKTLRVKGDVDADLINGRKLIDSYLHASADQTIETPIRIEGLTAAHVHLLGESSTLNGVPNQVLFASHTLPYNIHRGDFIIRKPINISSLTTQSLQGENFDQLVSSLALVNQTNHFQAPVIFNNTLKIEGALTTGDLNGVDLKTFTDDVVLKDVEANVTAKKSFQQSVRTPQLKTTRIVCDFVSPDVTGTAAQAVRLDGHNNNEMVVTGTVRFDDIHVQGDIQLSTLNGHSFPDGYITLDSEQDIPGDLVADRIVLLGNISLEDGARVNGLNLKAEFANTWMLKDNNEKVLSTKTFTGQVRMVRDLSVNQNVNGVASFAEEVFELDQGGTIYGAPQWNEVVVDADVGRVDLTNDVDIADLATRTFYVDEPISTNAKWTLTTANITGKNFLLPVEANINEIPFTVGQLIGNQSSSLRSKDKGNQDRKVYEVARQWHQSLRQAYFKMDHLNLHQTIYLPHQVTSVSEMKVNGSSFLLVGTRGGSLVYRRRRGENSYTGVGIHSGMGSVSKWLPLPDISDQDHKLVSFSTPTTVSNVTGAKLWNITAEPFELKIDRDFGSDVVDITGESIHNLRFTYTDNATLTRTLPMVPGNWSGKLQIFERLKTASSSANPFNSDFKMHTFQLGSKQMMALIMTYSSDISASLVGCPGVRIYSTLTGPLRLEHIIPACDVRAVTSFTHGNLPDHYFLLAEHDAVIVYCYEGASGFVERFRLPYPSASALHSWTLDDSDQVFVAVGKADRLTLHKAVTIGDYIHD